MPAVNINKRHGADILIKSKRFLIFASWIIIFASFIIFSVSKPKTDTMFDRFYDTMSYGAWDRNLIKYTYNMMFPLFIVSSIGLLINSSRHRRKRDTYSKSLVIFTVVSLAVIILYNIFR